MGFSLIFCHCGQMEEPSFLLLEQEFANKQEEEVRRIRVEIDQSWKYQVQFIFHLTHPTCQLLSPWGLKLSCSGSCPRVAQKREDAVSKEVTRKLSEADNKKMSQKEKDERILWKKNEVADYEATTFSIFYNNTLFLVLVIVASFFILKNFNPTVNYILSISASSGLIPFCLLAPSRLYRLWPLALYIYGWPVVYGKVTGWSE